MVDHARNSLSWNPCLFCYLLDGYSSLDHYANRFIRNEMSGERRLYSPLTAPAVGPSTNRFCTKEKRMMVGTMVKTVAAATWPQRMRNAEASLWMTKVTVAVLRLWLIIETIDSYPQDTTIYVNVPVIVNIIAQNSLFVKRDFLLSAGWRTGRLLCRLSGERRGSVFSYMRGIYLVKVSTHAFCNAVFWGCHRSEEARSLRLLCPVRSRMLLIGEAKSTPTLRRCNAA